MISHLETAASLSAAPAPPRTGGGERQHILTVALEDYFQVGALRGLIQREHWDRLEPRLDTSTHRALDLLDRFQTRATFFVSGWVAQRCPALVAEVAERGHELAASGFEHRRIGELGREQFRDDALRSRDAVEQATGRRVWGYRIADQWLGPDDLWALDELAQLGFRYDSSLAPWLGRRRLDAQRRFAHEHETAGGLRLWELPPATWEKAGRLWPIAGGNYFRQLPHRLLRHGLSAWDANYAAPLVVYFHVWELDPEQPRLSGVGFWSRIRHYRNLAKMNWVLAEYLERYSFGTVADYLNLPSEPSRAVADEPIASAAGDPLGAAACAASSLATPVTIVIPCFNEESTTAYLANTLRSLRRELAGEYQLAFVLVDDGSQDQTWERLQQHFGSWPQVQLVRHPRNRGVSAAIMTGIRQAQTEIVCSIDGDCSYDPLELRRMIPRLTPGVDLVTASPYHPLGSVRNVPSWRLGLSRGASWLYRRALRHSLSTYTSCFRVYRRSAVAPLDLKEDGFLGIVELLTRLDDRPGAIAEHPATLDVRLFGQSKMRVARTVGGHLRFLSALAWSRLKSPLGASPASPAPTGTSTPGSAAPPVSTMAPHPPLTASGKSAG